MKLFNLDTTHFTAPKGGKSNKVGDARERFTKTILGSMKVNQQKSESIED